MQRRLPSPCVPLLLVLAALTGLPHAHAQDAPSWELRLPEDLAIPAGATRPLWAEIVNHGATPLEARVTTFSFERPAGGPGGAGSGLSGSQQEETLVVPPGGSGRVRMDLTPRATSPEGDLWRVHVSAVAADGARQEGVTAVRVVAPGLPERLDEAALAASVGALGGLGVWAMGRPAARGALLAPLVPLYARVKGGDALSHATRRRILDLVRAQPGLAYADLKKAVGGGGGTFVHHLRVLEREGHVVSRRAGAARRLYPAGAAPPTPLTQAEERLVAALGASARTQRELAEALGLTQQGVSWHLRRLAARGVVARDEDGRWRRAGA